MYDGSLSYYLGTVTTRVGVLYTAGSGIFTGLKLMALYVGSFAGEPMTIDTLPEFVEAFTFTLIPFTPSGELAVGGIIVNCLFGLLVGGRWTMKWSNAMYGR